MTTLDFGTPSQYAIRFSVSPVFECALGIAAFTREEIYDKLERNLDELRSMRHRMSEELTKEVRLCSEVHSWRNLLFLAHRCPYLSDAPVKQHIKLFLNWIIDHEETITELAAPYLGEACSSELLDGLSGNVAAQRSLIHSHSDNPVVHLNLRYLFAVNSHAFLDHLKTLLQCWHDEILAPDWTSIGNSIQLDEQHKRQLSQDLPATDLIRTVTKGSELQPVPGTDTLWLIPQFAYRPFTIINYLPHTVVYYYPISDEFLPGGVDQGKLAQVAALHKALGDAQRIRLLTMIRHRPKSLAELTDTLNATKSNVHHHLTLLRTAGLVKVHDGVYSIDHSAISQVGDDLRALLEA